MTSYWYLYQPLLWTVSIHSKQSATTQTPAMASNHIQDKLWGPHNSLRDPGWCAHHHHPPRKPITFWLHQPLLSPWITVLQPHWLLCYSIGTVCSHLKAFALATPFVQKAFASDFCTAPTGLSSVAFSMSLLWTLNWNLQSSYPPATPYFPQFLFPFFALSPQHLSPAWYIFHLITPLIKTSSIRISYLSGSLLYL